MARYSNRRTQRDAPTRFAIIISLLAAAVGPAACGSSSPSGTATNALAGSNSKTLEFASCIRSHGVSNFPDSPGGHLPVQIQHTPNGTTVNGVEVNGPAFQSALRACRSYAPHAPPASPAQTAKANTQALAMSRCMRSHGVPNFPDPKMQTGPYGGIAFSVNFGGTGIDPNSPAFQVAQKDCASIFGAPKVAPGG